MSAIAVHAITSLSPVNIKWKKILKELKFLVARETVNNKKSKYNLFYSIENLIEIVSKKDKVNVRILF